MERQLFQVKIYALVAIIMLGLAFHGLYKITGLTPLALISPVNESKWEHWKMAFFPMIIVAVFEYFLIREHTNNYLFALAVGVIIFEFVTFGAIEIFDLVFGHAGLLIHVFTFLLGAIIGQFSRYYLMVTINNNYMLQNIGISIIIAQLFIFAVFTYNPPQLSYFRDSISGNYGINGSD